MIQSLEGEGSGFFPQLSWFFPQVLIVLELVKISGMGYASVVCLVGKRSTFSKYTESSVMHRPCSRDGYMFVYLIFARTLRGKVGCAQA